MELVTVKKETTKSGIYKSCILQPSPVAQGTGHFGNLQVG
jgi:hypothetical protein